MTRPYTLRKRAEQQADTRRRIVEAAVELHSSVGPAQTTFSMVAERASVQRHTLYAHFPNERSLFAASSSLAAERHPVPDASPWRALEDRRERLTTGIRAIYDWYERQAPLLARVLRDAEHHALTRDIARTQFARPFAEWKEALGAGLDHQQRAMLGLALRFFSWRYMSRDAGLSQDAAVDMMVLAIDGVGQGEQSRRAGAEPEPEEARQASVASSSALP
ncbi:helix-turn-helix domain-containing protein [Mesorhizobium sp. LHD-90]|uniref:TetR/AcrR family transcriptional regulator n=1 Tax=Mesorhizobium sp. LHD-90 TaxID=3071414 RepID=UPI0027E04A61|nr:helix-turn-helix domain-containing protein [Mesorhizobium sp. LHD-90]MDQ6435188.1 helix-turn-helix domain-containing protein [Mesorhizobium sp. LHD-90]